jgi:phage terminase large subunit
MLNQAAKMMHKRVGVYWHCFPSFRQARKAIWDGIDDKTGVKFIDQAFPPAIRKKPPNNTEMKIELKCGSIYQFIGSDNYDSLVGANPIHITISEWPLCKPSVWNFVSPILRVNEGSAAFIYTPRGKNHGYELLQRAKRSKKWYWSVDSIIDTGVLKDEDLNEERDAGIPEAIINQEYYCDFEAPNEGAIYKLPPLETFHVDPEAKIYTSWDLGFTDSTAIWFWTIRPDGGIDFIDCFEAHHSHISFYVEVMLRKNYKYDLNWLPHDGSDNRFKLVTGLTIKNYLEAAGLKIKVVPKKISVVDGINSGRTVLKKARFHSRCADGYKALESYQYEWDQDKRSFSNQPNHDWTSHYADAFRMGALAYFIMKTIEPATKNDNFVPYYEPEDD